MFIMRIEMKGGDTAMELQKKFDWMKQALQELARDFKKEFPDTKNGDWKYFLFNRTHWE